MKQQPPMYLLPKVQKAVDHKDCDCPALGLRGAYHRPAVIPDACLKTGLLAENKVSVTPAGLQVYENPGRVYYYSEEAENHLLSIPQPYLTSPRWPSKLYRPAMASLDSKDPKVTLYYGLYSTFRSRQMAATYQRPPSEWMRRENPYYDEPEHKSELGLISSEFYGLESVQRIGFCAHPGSEPYIRLYLLTRKEDLSVPCLDNSNKRRGELESAIADTLKPFYTLGHGLVMCPVCIMVEERGRLEPVFLSKQEYRYHWEAKHYCSLVASTTFSATQLHTRIFSGHLLYTLMLANWSYIAPFDDRDLLPYDEKAYESRSLRTNRDYHLFRVWQAARSNYYSMQKEKTEELD